MVSIRQIVFLYPYINDLLLKFNACKKIAVHNIIKFKLSGKLSFVREQVDRCRTKWHISTIQNVFRKLIEEIIAYNNRAAWIIFYTLLLTPTTYLC